MHGAANEFLNWNISSGAAYKILLNEMLMCVHDEDAMMVTASAAAAAS